MTALFFIILFVFGLVIGSFLNVLIWRYHPDGKLFDGKKLSGRSHCPYCHRKLKASELVPLGSFFIQKGKCRECGHKLSWQYPLVEFLSGAIFAGLPWFLNGFYNVNNFLFANFALSFWYYALVFLWVLAFLVWLVIAVIDLRHYVIPNELNLLLAVFGIFAVVLLALYANQIFPFRSSFLKNYELIFFPFQNVILNRLLGMAAGGLFFGFLVFLSRGRGMGIGDVKLALASGLALGWPDIGLVTVISFFIGACLSGILLLAGQKTMQDKIPFAPFFVLAVFITVFFGHAIISGYFNLFRI